MTDLADVLRAGMIAQGETEHLTIEDANAVSGLFAIARAIERLAKAVEVLNDDLPVTATIVGPVEVKG